MALSSAAVYAQEGVTYVTQYVQPAIHYVGSRTTPQYLKCGSAGECLQNQFEAVQAYMIAQQTTTVYSYSIVNIRAATDGETINGVTRAHYADLRTDWVDYAGNAHSYVQANVFSTGVQTSCPEGGERLWFDEVVQPPPQKITVCKTTVSRPQSPCRTCPTATVGNPIALSTGQKVVSANDYSDATGALRVTRHHLTANDALADDWSLVGMAKLVDLRNPAATADCFMSYYGQVDIESGISGARKQFPYCFKYGSPASPQQAITVYTGDHRWIQFLGSGTSWASTDGSAVIQIIGDGTPQRRYLLRREQSDGYDVFDATGRLTRRVKPNGDTLTYESDVAVSVGGQSRLSLQLEAKTSGRKVNLVLNPDKTWNTLLLPDGDSIKYRYGGANVNCTSPEGCARLSEVEYPDGKSVKYVYGEPAYVPGGSAHWDRLTGIIDERNIRFATYQYDTLGRAISTEHAGGVDRFLASYTRHPVTGGIETATLTDPKNVTSTMTFLQQGLATYVAGRSQPAGSGSPAASTLWGYDSSGNVTSIDDVRGYRTCLTNDLSRRLELVQLEGLPSNAQCTTALSSATLSDGQRKTTTQWHPDWRLETKVARPGSITSYVYNGQPDPFNGNAIASCAPTTALLPDGKRIAVLCKRVEQSTNDSTGAAGFSATMQTAVSARTWKWTYNEAGQVLSEDGPRTDVTDVTNYVYYTATTADYTKGDLQRITNAAGKATQFTKYNKHGQVLESVDPNSVLTVNEYYPRQWLKSTTVGGQKTSYDYDFVGQLKKVTLPDSSFIEYEYDDAHRLKVLKDNLGNRTEYDLDNAGNRKGETTTDPGGALKRQLTRVIDALGRVQQTTGRD